jgi:hypothetical protein
MCSFASIVADYHLIFFSFPNPIFVFPSDFYGHGMWWTGGKAQCYLYVQFHVMHRQWSSGGDKSEVFGLESITL